MNIPVITYQVSFQEGVVGVLSKTPPYNTCTVIFSCNQHIKTFKSMVTYEDDEYGKDKGLQIEYMTDKPADTQFEFEINAITDFLQEDGMYRIGMYVENDEGIWNEFFLFITTENNSHKYFMTNDNKVFNVK